MEVRRPCRGERGREAHCDLGEVGAVPLRPAPVQWRYNQNLEIESTKGKARVFYKLVTMKQSVHDDVEKNCRKAFKSKSL